MSAVDISGLLRLLLFPLIVLEVCAVVSWAWSANRFNHYIKTKHPAKWSELVPPRRDFRFGNTNMDISTEVCRFRRRSTDDLGDPELQRRRGKTNRSEKLAILGFLGLLTVVVICAFISSAVQGRIGTPPQAASAPSLRRCASRRRALSRSAPHRGAAGRASAAPVWSASLSSRSRRVACTRR